MFDVPNISNDDQINILYAMLDALGNTTPVENISGLLQNNLLYACLKAIIANGTGGGGGTTKILSQFGTEFTLSVDEESDENNLPLGTGSIQITKI